MRFLIVTDSPLVTTGLGKSARNVGRALAERGHTVGYAGHLHDGAPHPEFDAPIWPWARFNPEVPRVSLDLVGRAIADFAPDQVILLGDAWHFLWLPELRRQLELRQAGGAPTPRQGRPGLLLWLTVDCAPFPRAVYAEGVLDAADWLATTTGFGADVLSGRCVAPGIGRIADLHYRVQPIPLGVDKDVFTPEGRAELRAMYWPNRVVLGWCGLNCGRKHPGAALETLVALRAGGVDAALLMKTQPATAEGGNILEMCAHLGLRYSGERQPASAPDCDVYVNNVAMSEEQLANFYRGLDLFLCSSSAGAPELPILEARSCGVPAVAVNTAHFREVANIVAEPTGHCWASPNVIHEMPDPKALAGAVQYALAHGLDADVAGVPTWGQSAEGLLAAVAGVQADWLPGITL